VLGCRIQGQTRNKRPQNSSKRPLFDILYGKLKRPLRPTTHCHYGQYALGRILCFSVCVFVLIDYHQNTKNTMFLGKQKFLNTRFSISVYFINENLSFDKQKQSRVYLLGLMKSAFYLNHNNHRTYWHLYEINCIIWRYDVVHLKTNIYLQILDRPSRISTKLFLNFFNYFYKTKTRFFFSKFIHY
jgi:hypothetical protein